MPSRLHNAANVLCRQLPIKQKCLQFVSEHVQQYVWCAQFSWKTVPCPRSLDSEAVVAVVRSVTWNSQSTNVCRSKFLAADRWLAIRWRYCGAMPCWHWYIRTANLNEIHCRTSSQWRSGRTGVICSDLLAPVTRRAAAFWITCSLCSSWLGVRVSSHLVCSPFIRWTLTVNLSWRQHH